MTIFPLHLEALIGKPLMYLVYLLIGFGFGYVLEISGFSDSPVLAAQFYFKDLRVLKVMFTAIVVAMVLIFLSTALGILDYNLIWVNPTYLWSGIIGGLIMGVGFIVGGFCPGTSIVAASTLKIDGIIFVLGGLVGVTLFGESEKFFQEFYHGSYYGRLTLMDFLNLPTGIVVLLVVLMALFMFWGGEQLERIIGKKDLSKEPALRYAGAGALVVGALVVLLIGQPANSDRWDSMASQQERRLQERSVYVQPGELLQTMHDHKLNLIMIDVRPETDYNMFHIARSRHIPLEELPEYVGGFHLEPARTLFVLISNDETTSTQAWKYLVAESIPNVYILDGGINHWLTTFWDNEAGIEPQVADTADETLAFDFAAVLGASYVAADPDPHQWEGKIEYIPTIKMDLKRAPTSGGCG
ncbi:MAG: YeeE/YedE family protein [Anaerolineales bacterium]|nr:YeeE/YedE family protein [Anaerolineales bacterium]